mmetsp:Transcript_105909/g.338220  ORF Transcript_105909/g.338220 Transcript_105909/m.338220 type:complete len:343 (-) Transcript_105909:34-1062(-)
MGRHNRKTNFQMSKPAEQEIPARSTVQRPEHTLAMPSEFAISTFQNIVWGDRSCVEFVADPQPKGLASAVEQLRIAQLVRQLQGVPQVHAAVLVQAHTSRGLVVSADATPQVPLRGEPAVHAVPVDTDVHASIHMHHIVEIAREGDVVTQSAVFLRDAQSGLSAERRPLVGSSVGLRRIVALRLQGSLAAADKDTQPAAVHRAAELVDAHGVFDAVAHLRTARKLTAHTQTARHAAVRGAGLPVDVRTGELRQQVPSHREVVLLVAVEFHLHVPHILHTALLGGLPRHAAEVPALTTHTQRGVMPQQAGLPRLLFVHADVQLGVLVQRCAVVRVQAAVLHGQ